MTSPDARAYVDLTLFDATSQGILQKALDYALVALPEYQPQEGTIETVMLQAMALEVQEAIYSINRLPGAIVEVLLRLLDVERQDGARATATVRFTGQTTTPFTVPIGTRMLYQTPSVQEYLLLETTSAVTGTHIKNIASISRAGTVLTVETTTRHGLSVGDSISISETGSGSLNMNDVVIASVVDSTTFTVTVTSSGSASAATGIVTPDGTILATAFVQVRSAENTSVFNGLAAETELSLLSVVPSVASAILETQLTGGLEPEDDAVYFARASATLSRLTGALVTSTQIEQFIVESGRYPDAFRVLAVDTTNATRVSNVAGQVMIAAAPIDATSTNLLSGQGDGSLTTDDPGYGTKDSIYDGVAQRIEASLDVTVVDPCLVTVDVTTVVGLPDGVISTDSIDACTARLEQYLSPNTWDWSDTIRANELVYELRQSTIPSDTVPVPACSYVESVTITPTNVYVPVESRRFDVASVSRTSGVCEVVLASNHGITKDSGEELWIKVGATTADSGSFNTSTIVPVTLADTNRFQYSQGSGNFSSTNTDGYVVPIKRTVAGDLIAYDPAVLVVSGTHDVSIA